MIMVMLTCAVGEATAAAWRISGRVADSAGEVLPGVVVKMSDSSGSTVAFCSTDGKGGFTLKYQQTPDPKWHVSFGLLGFATKTLAAGRLHNGMMVTLEEAPLELKEVVVKVPSIKSIGDTLVYDVASFRSASDRNIEDVIKKLPGVEVSPEGRIYYNGESINRFYIEGLDVVGGRYAIATRNISPDDIISVSVYENHQPKRVLKDISFSEKAAINLKMKKKSMLKPVGNVKGGAGADDNSDAKWLGEIFGMLIAPGSQTIITGKGNNWGKSYTNETRSLISESTGKSSVASGLYGATPFGTAQIPAERYFDNRSASASVNTVAKFGEYGKLGFTADYTDENNRITNSESITYSNGDDPSIGFHESIRSHPHSREVKGGLNVEYNAPKNYISDKLTFRGRFADNSYGISNAGEVRQLSRTDDYSFKNAFDGTVRIGNRIISVKSDIAVVNTPVSRLSAADAGSGVTTLAQRGRALTFTTDERASYTWMLGAYSHIGASLRFQSAYDMFRSDYSSESSGTAANDVKGHDLTLTVTPQYQYKPNTSYSLNIQVPVSYSSMSFDNLLSGAKYPTDRVDMGAKVSFNMRPGANFRASLTLGQQNTLGGIKDYIVNPVYTTYRQRTTFGSGELNLRKSYSASTNLNYRDPVKAFFATLTALYRIGHNNRISGSDVTPGQVTGSVEKSDNRSHMFMSSLSLSKNMRSWRTTFTLDGHVNYLSRKILRQKKPYTVDNTSYVVHASVKSNPVAQLIDISLEGWYRPSVQKISSLGTRNSVDDFEAQASVSVHPVKRVELYSQLYWNSVTLPSGSSKESLFVGAGVRVHAGRKFDIEVSGKNLSNCKSYAYSYFVDSDLYSYTFALRPIEFLATVKYTF